MKVFGLILLTLSITTASSNSRLAGSVETADPIHRHNGRSFIYTSAVNNNGQTSSFSIFTGSDGKLHYMKENPEGQVDHGLLDDNVTLKEPVFQQDALYYFPHAAPPGELFHNNLQFAINNAVQNYLQNLGI